MSTIKFRRGTAVEWAVRNPVLADGEPGVETDTRKFKVGRLDQRWLDLPYYATHDQIAQDIQAALDNFSSGGIELPDLVLLWENAKA